jgi:hypothetical protein
MIHCWPTSHIFNELLKTIPGFADSNSPAAISWPSVVFGVLTTLFHSSPTLIFGRLAAILSIAPFSFRHTTETSTRDAKNKFPPIYARNLSALNTAAYPHKISSD